MRLNTILEYVPVRFRNWTFAEKTWLALATATVTAVSAWTGDSWCGTVSALTGVVCVILTGKGSLSAYAYGIVNCVSYAYISYGQRLYGEVMLNMLWYLPLQFYGFAVWKRNMHAGEVRRRDMGRNARFGLAAAVAGGTAVYGMALAAMRDPLPYIDSFTTVASVCAMWLSCRRYAEQWYLWIAVDVMSIWMWAERYAAGGENAATLAMWAVFLINALYGCVKWEKAAERE